MKKTNKYIEIPKTVRIGGKLWHVHRRIKDVRAAKDESEREELRGTNGCTYYETKEIYVDRKLSLRGASSTFLHEIMHACSGEHSKFEEAFIRRIETKLFHVLEQLNFK